LNCFGTIRETSRTTRHLPSSMFQNLNFDVVYTRRPTTACFNFIQPPDFDILAILIFSRTFEKNNPLYGVRMGCSVMFTEIF
jgi:hypothetical protein